MKNHIERPNFNEKSPRELELTEKVKQKNITEEEKGELYGLRMFPHNPRGQELRKKEHLGLLTEEEKLELRKINLKRYRQEKLSPELQELWRRIEEKDPNVKHVTMDSGKAITLTSEDKEEKIIFTDGLGGCYATLIYSEDDFGNKTAILTHFSPIAVRLNELSLRDLIDTNPGIKKSSGKQTVFVLGVENHNYDEETGEYHQGIFEQEYIDRLISVMKAELGDNIDVNVVPYPGSPNAREKDFGTFVVRLSPNKQSSYKTWFSQGVLKNN